ncbi:MAG TPA: hypothetical protein PLQ97_03370 [Myxococcota bacterium]|nr:hypothetical protein [Myxococcota bacterium]HQK50105.1 hypothetical protein [Myxococcota bacterium]
MLASLMVLAWACGGGGTSAGDLPGDPGTGDAPTVPEDLSMDARDPVPADLPGSEAGDVQEGVDEDGVLDVPADGDGGTEEGPVPGDWRMPALRTCQASRDPCEAEAALIEPVGSVRRDFFLPYDQYPEDDLPDPAEGRRVQVVAVAGTSGVVTGVQVGDLDVTALALPAESSSSVPEAVTALVDRGWHFLHVWPMTLAAGSPFWITWHQDDPALDTGTSVRVRVWTDQGTALDALVPLAPPGDVRLTYVTTADDHRTLLVHLRNDAPGPRTLRRIRVNGLDLTEAACIPDPVLAPGATALWTVPLCKALSPGDPWTVITEFEEGPPAVGAGRVVMPHFPIHAWVNSDDCPFPGADFQNFRAHWDQGFDTPFLRGAFPQEHCQYATAREVVSKSQHLPGWHSLLDEWADIGDLDDTRVARLLGDEVDSNRRDKPWRVSQDAKRSFLRRPRMTTCIGGARHRMTGAYAGIADVQGFDIYFAACAPSILVGQIPPLRAPLDYCRAVRENQAPGPVWFYSQGLAGWNDTRDPDPMELKVSALSVMACGAKGLMYFQTDLGRARAVPATWEAMGEVNRVFRAVRRFLREGDPTGAASATDPDVWTEAIRSREALVVPVINGKVDQGLDLVRCLFEDDPHWSLQPVVVDVRVRVPEDFSVEALWEVEDGQVRPVTDGAFSEGRDLVLPQVSLDNDRPYRVFVLGRDPGIAARMAADMAISDPGPPPETAAREALVRCSPPQGACEAPAFDPGIRASLRKDFFYPYEQYPEAGIPDPVLGGRVHLTAMAGASGRVQAVRIAGRDVSSLLRDDLGGPSSEVTALTEDGWMHWLHVWPTELRAGDPFWIAFHASHSWLEGTGPFSVEVVTDQGVALDGAFSPTIPEVPIRYVTSSRDHRSLLVHLRNESPSARRLERLVVHGRDVTGSACIPDPEVEAGQEVMWEVPLCEAVRRGDPWTVTAFWDDGSHSTAGGRVLVPHFGIHTWPSSSDCPFPGANEANWQRHREAGFDTPFLWKSTYASYEGCNGATAQDILAAAEAVPDQWLMVSKDIDITGFSTDRLLWFTGDEPDSEVGSAPWEKARYSRRAWRTTPEMATYVGGSRHRHNGAFAGVTDIQGFDIYISACAPYILDFGHFPPLRAPYDFARAVRSNQSPWPTWIYSHGMLGKTDPVREPSPSEIWVQALSPIAAGTKGLMYFQTSMKGADRRPESWRAIAEANRMVRAVRDELVLGDPTGGARADRDGVIVEAIRTPASLVVPVINVTAREEMNDLRCLFEEDPHWVLEDVVTTVRVSLPPDLAVGTVQEHRDGTWQDPEGIPYRLGQDLVIPSVRLSEQRPVRLFRVAGP